MFVNLTEVLYDNLMESGSLELSEMTLKRKAECEELRTLKPGETIKVPTGIRANMEEGWVLQIFPRSSLGFKFRLQLNNTVGIIDSDYYYSDNEGHMFIKVIIY